MTGVLAAAPILVILVLMLGLRWSAARAGIVGVTVAALLAWRTFGLGATVYPDVGATAALGGALGEAVFTAFTILWILLPALCIHHLQGATGAVEVLRLAIGRLSPDPRIVAILIAWFFALFLEGAAGFGTPIALTAPFLVSAGFAPVQAVSIALIGHAIGVSFGAVGTPVLPQIAVTEFVGVEISRATGIFHALLGWVMLVILMRLVTRHVAVPPGLPATVRGWVAAAALLFAVPFALIATYVGPELPTLGGALVGGVLFVAAVARLRGRSVGRAVPRGAGEGTAAALLRAAAPYLALVAVILTTRLIAPLREALRGVEWSWSAMGEFGGSVLPLFHPGTALLVGFVAGALVQRASPAQVAGAVGKAARQLLPVTVALVAMLGLSRVMVHAGMIDVLATAAAAGLGGAWPLFAPFVGVLGTFVTGSATASNILFTDFQEAAARNLGLPVLTLIGAQGFGAAVGNIVCPHNIIAGGATVGLSGREGEILRNTVLPCLLYAALGGALALVLVRW